MQFSDFVFTKTTKNCIKNKKNKQKMVLGVIMIFLKKNNHTHTQTLHKVCLHFCTRTTNKSKQNEKCAERKKSKR